MILQELNRFTIETIISPWRDILRVYSHGAKRLLHPPQRIFMSRQQIQQKPQSG